MKQSLLMDFSINKEKATVIVKKECAAPQDVVWAAWTESEHLDQWWAPKPWTSKTKSMDFRVGGRRLYAMISPKGETSCWAFADYTSITPKSNFRYRDGFCDSEGNRLDDKPPSDWDVSFLERNGITTVNVSIKHAKLSDLEQLIEMGFKEGFIMALGNLDELFAKNGD